MTHTSAHSQGSSLNRKTKPIKHIKLPLQNFYSMTYSKNFKSKQQQKHTPYAYQKQNKLLVLYKFWAPTHRFITYHHLWNRRSPSRPPHFCRVGEICSSGLHYDQEIAWAPRRLEWEVRSQRSQGGWSVLISTLGSLGDLLSTKPIVQNDQTWSVA